MTSLKLIKTGITDKGAEKIIDALKYNTTLINLNLT